MCEFLRNFGERIFFLLKEKHRYFDDDFPKLEMFLTPMPIRKASINTFNLIQIQIHKLNYCKSLNPMHTNF